MKMPAAETPMAIQIAAPIASRALKLLSNVGLIRNGIRGRAWS